MVSALIEALVEAVVAAAGWVARIVRGVFGGAAVEAGASAAEGAARGRRGRRQYRARLRDLADRSDFDEMERMYHRNGCGDNNRGRRIDALTELAKVAPGRAEPLLRDVIEASDDPWLIMAVLDTAARQRIVGLRDAMATAREDPRPMVAEAAKASHSKLARSARGS